MYRNVYLVAFLITALIIAGLVGGCSSLNSATDEAQKSASTVTNSVSSASNSDKKDYGALGAAQDKNLTMEKMLVYAIQDEYLARSEYEYVLTTFGDQKPLNNILQAEELHIAELKILFDKYKLTMPEDTSKDHLIVAGSFEDALKIGVQAEINNIAMYESFLNQDLPEDVKAAFLYLKAGSENHLAAFQKNLGN
jgi:hypothetical protein